MMRPYASKAELELDALILNDPNRAAESLKAFNLLLGKGAEYEPDDTRIAAIPESIEPEVTPFSIGLPAIMEKMHGFKPGDLLAIGAREGHGKTALGTKIALANSREHRVVLQTLEMTREEIRDACLCKLMLTGRSTMLNERVRQTDDYRAARKALAEMDLHVPAPKNRADRSVKALTKYAEDLSAAVLIIDHAREIAGWQPGSDASKIVEYLGRFAKASGIAVVLLSQLKGDAIGRPRNDHFQDTTRISQRADRAILLWRPYYGNPSRDRICEIIVSKNRGGPPFRAHAHWVGETMDFWDMAPEEERLVPCCHRKPRTAQTQRRPTVDDVALDAMLMEGLT
jgi:replicative DNA helicase